MRAARLLMALLVSLGAAWLAALSAPSFVHACSCALVEPGGIAKVNDDPDTVVFIGTVLSQTRQNNLGHTSGDIKVERVFKGALPAVIRAMGGGGGDCTMSLDVGQRLIMAAPFVDGLLTPSVCGYHADPQTADGRTMIDAAVTAFGPGVLPGDPSSGSTEMPDDPDLTGFAVGMVGIFVLVVVIGVVASVMRGREER